jgi:sodium-dependent phosphate cotransporter
VRSRPFRDPEDSGVPDPAVTPLAVPLHPPPPASRGGGAWRVAALIALLYGFLVAIGLMESAFKSLGSGTSGGLFDGIDNPFAALFVGILATVLVQSSSVTTSTIVALVGSGQVSMAMAVPMEMGANIGTTVTNTLVSIGSVRRTLEFRRAFACATVHDVFNVLSVLVLLPLELATGLLHEAAQRLASGVGGAGTIDATFRSPVKQVVKAGVSAVEGLLGAVGLAGPALSWAGLLLAVALILWCLSRIMRLMRTMLVSRIEASLNRAMGRSGLLGIAVGAVLTFVVQSSSITTSMLVPLAGAGILSLENAYPIVLGCNLGTTSTALLASLATGSPAALAIAIVHLLFNLLGTLLFYCVPGVRRVPPAIATWLASVAARNEAWLAVYALGIFVLVPLAGILLFK